MAYHYTESGLDNIWLVNGYEEETDPDYGELISFKDVLGLHKAIGRWIISQPRPLTGAEFRFLRVEMDMSQKLLGTFLGVTDQAVAKWEKEREEPVSNHPADRCLRGLYSGYVGDDHFFTLIKNITDMDATEAENALRLENSDKHWSKAA